MLLSMALDVVVIIGSMLKMSKRSLEDITKQFKSLLKTDDELFLENVLDNEFKSPISTFNSIYKRFDIYKILIGYEHKTGISDFYIKDMRCKEYYLYFVGSIEGSMRGTSRWLYPSLSLKDLENIKIHVFFSTPGMSEDIFEKYVNDKDNFWCHDFSNMKRYNKNDEILSTYNKKLNKESHDIVTNWDIYLHTSYKNGIIQCAAAHYGPLNRSSKTFFKSRYEIDITRGFIYKK